MTDSDKSEIIMIENCILYAHHSFTQKAPFFPEDLWVAIAQEILKEFVSQSCLIGGESISLPGCLPLGPNCEEQLCAVSMSTAKGCDGPVLRSKLTWECPRSV